NADKITEEVWTVVHQNEKQKTKIDFNQYTGTFKDNWFGEVTIYEQKGKLHFASKRSKRLVGEVLWYKNQNFIVKWNVRSFNADSHIFFDVDADGKVNHFKMEAISPMTDFSYDFHDLDFQRIK
ncbi:DUF3471 domain-containing protein, partial [Flavobacterium sp.]|uniref:DUF3471 domain-containing protein n=1 Tax=Flavobacterium sp. TaxID=239 RepID=UPI0037C005A6